MEEKALEDLRVQVIKFPDRAGFITVHSQNTLDRANDFLKDIIVWEKKVDALLDPNIKRLNKVHKEALADKATFKEPLKKSKEIVRGKITTYLIEQENIRLEVEMKATLEKEKRFEEARELEKAGDKKEAERIREEETKLATPLPPIARAEGTSLRRYWTWKVVDIDIVPREHFILDEKGINEIVQKNKDKTNIPGIVVFQKAGIATRIK